ncbi:chaperone protein dnaJ 11, chloroplastic [Humulus lupulus]|uniref:chaperone protein dnaJ 11, chloroplastic n=1 Tax=Humulus lupulus TaxID=3486 RepID=UPI002B410B6B|nr:chaperone protein dnaJ 11, chloroplastic [Humulus lupulus]
MLSVPSSTSFLSPSSLSPRSSQPPSPTSVRFATTRASAASTSYASAESETTTSYLNARRNTAASLYQILGIPTAATCQEIKAAYRKLARVCHPDVATIDRKDSSADEFMKIHAAYSTLSDPTKRADYDRRFLRRQSPLTMASGFNGYSRRNWETDQCW